VNNDNELKINTIIILINFIKLYFQNDPHNFVYILGVVLYFTFTDYRLGDGIHFAMAANLRHIHQTTDMSKLDFGGPVYSVQSLPVQPPRTGRSVRNIISLVSSSIPVLENKKLTFPAQ